MENMTEFTPEQEEYLLRLKDEIQNLVEEPNLLGKMIETVLKDREEMGFE